LFTALLVAVACGTASAELIERRVNPLVTDASITGGTSTHRHMVYFDDAVPHPGRLFVFLPGTNGPPQAYKLITQTAAQIGYHALALAYVNELSINEDICAGQALTCPEDARLEIIEGVDYTPLIQVSRADSIENRLIKLLQYLAAQFPSEGWQQFLDAGQLRWELMAFAGHSQGGGHAAMLGKIHSVHRVAMFSSTEPALWTREPLLTPPARFFAFAHTLEESFNGITLSWANLQLPGALTSVDNVPPPSAGSHRLQTTAPPRDLVNFHGCVVVDLYTPLQPDGVTPVFRNVWIYMIGPAVSGPDPLTVVPSITGNNVKLTWPTMPGEQFRIEQSTDLVGWSELADPLFATGFAGEHIVAGALQAPVGFYRVQRK
jgi:hypothetical protein